ncbi:MAG: hypothetical protein UHN47_03415 [Lachnospiraceae bacterium]|nr:hypothetical protein [Lachnospiraceae bacterium]
MCKVGDIIVVNKAKVNNKEIGRHSFIVLNTDKGEIEGLPFDLVCNLMSSFDGKGDDYKAKKLSYPENMPYSPNDENIIDGHGKEGFIKAGVYFFFNKENTDFYVIGNVEIALYLKLLEFINNMNEKDIKYIIDNLKN